MSFAIPAGAVAEEAEPFRAGLREDLKRYFVYHPDATFARKLLICLETEGVWALTVYRFGRALRTRRMGGVFWALYRLLQTQRAAGNPVPTVQDVLDLWRKEQPAEIAEVLQGGKEMSVRAVACPGCWKTLYKLVKPANGEVRREGPPIETDAKGTWSFPCWPRTARWLCSFLRL